MERDKELAIIRFLSEFGHLRFPFGREQDLPADIETLTLRDEAVQEAVRSHQDLDVNYQWLAGAVHGRPARADGDVGPVTEFMILEQKRCGHPDYSKALVGEEEEAIGSGSWKGCHGIGNFHAASMKQLNQPPAFLQPLWEDVKKRVTAMYDEVGLRWYFDGRQPVQTELTFVDSSRGWIGLAIVPGSPIPCGGDLIWLKLLAKYEGGNSPEAITRSWTSLLAHEGGHNAQLEHTRGGVMNPSITGAVTWKGDPSESRLRRLFGGEKIPGSEPPLPPPPLPPGPPDSVVISGGPIISGRKYILVPDPLYSSI